MNGHDSFVGENGYESVRNNVVSVITDLVKNKYPTASREELIAITKGAVQALGNAINNNPKLMNNIESAITNHEIPVFKVELNNQTISSLRKKIESQYKDDLEQQNKLLQALESWIVSFKNNTKEYVILNPTLLDANKEPGYKGPVVEYKGILAKAKELGFIPCSNPEIAALYFSNPISEGDIKEFVVAMEPLTKDNINPSIYRVATTQSRTPGFTYERFGKLESLLGTHSDTRKKMLFERI